MDTNDDVAATTANRRRQPRKKKKMLIGDEKAASAKSGDSIKPTKKKVNDVKPKGPSNLSFEDDEAGEPTFVIKKKKASKKAQERRVARVYGNDKPKHNSLRVAGQYSSETLNQLKQAQKSIPTDYVQPTMTIDDSGDNTTAAIKPTTAVPSNDMIHLARQQRKAAREREEFIPLNDKDDAGDKTGPSARLVREDADDLMDEGETQPLSFAEAARRRNHADRRQQVQTALQATSDNDVDMDLWSAQEKRGLRTVVVTNGTAHLATSDQTPQDSQERIEVDVSVRLKQLRTALASMKEVHGSHQQHMARLTDELDNLDVSIPKRESELEQVSAKYNFFQETKLYLRDLLSCLDAKVPEIEDCESQMHALFKQEADLLQARHRDDMHAWRTVLLSDAQHNPGMADATVRNRLQAYRHRQQQLAAAAGEANQSLPLDDDQLDEADATRLQAERKALLKEAEGLMADALDEYSELRAIAGQFETWKSRYPDTYAQAYITDSVKKIFKPLISLQLLRWNPLHADSPSLEEMAWFNDLACYGGRDGDPPADSDPDSRMVPMLVELAAVPKLAGYIEFLYDPLSTRQTSILVEQARMVLQDFELDRSSDAAKALFVAIESAVNRAVESFDGVDMFSMAFEQQQPELKVLHQHKLGLCYKLIKNLSAWRAMLQPHVLPTALGKLLDQHVYAHFGAHEDKLYCLNLTRGVINALPPAWRQQPAVATCTADIVIGLVTLLRAVPSVPASSWTGIAADVLELVGQTHRADSL